MIIQKRICDNCKKEIEEREDCYFKTSITAVNSKSSNNSANGDYCQECFKEICEKLQNIEPEEETKEETATSDESGVAAL